MDCDKSGIGVSFLCLLHCVGLPLIAIFYPNFAHDAYESQIHAVLAVLVLSLGFHAFYKGYQKHKNLCPAVFGTVGFATLMVGLFVQVQLPFTSSSEAFFSAVGSAFLVGAHILNMATIRHKGCSCKSESRKSFSPASVS